MESAIDLTMKNSKNKQEKYSYDLAHSSNIYDLHVNFHKEIKI